MRPPKGGVIPAMPLLVDEGWCDIYPPGWSHEPDDPYGFGLEYRDTISGFLDKHRVKIQKGARRCPFNALIVRPVGSKERMLNPKARAAMEKEWQ